MFRPIVFILLIAAAPALAQPVSSAGLDLATADGARAMLVRLERAAYQSCREPAGTIGHRRCIASTVAKSVAELNAPLVTETYQKNKR